MPDVLRSDEWELPEFVEHLSAQLDEVAETLALRAQRRDAVYSPSNVSLELNVTSRFDAAANKVLFRSAQPGDAQAGKLHFELTPVVREQLQPVAYDLLRPRDLRVIDLPLLTASGVADGQKALNSLWRLGVRTVGDVADMASTDPLRRVLAARTGLTLSQIAVLLRPFVERVDRNGDQWTIHGHHFGDTAGAAIVDGKALKIVDWNDQAIAAAGLVEKAKTLIVAGKETKSDPFPLTQRA